MSVPLARSDLDGFLADADADNDAGVASPPSPARRPVRRVPRRHDDDDSLFSLDPVRRWSAFGLQSMVRNPIVTLVGGVGGFVAAGLLLLASPPTHTAVTSLLVQQDQAISSDVNPDRTTALAPLGNGVSALVTSEAALDQLVLGLDLVNDEVDDTFFGHLRASIHDNLVGAPDEAARRASIEDDLVNAIQVIVTPGSATPNVTATSTGDRIDFVVSWPDDGQAAAIAAEVQQTFLDDRFDAEVTSRSAAVTILQKNLDAATARVAAVGGDPDAEVPRGSQLEQALVAEQEARSQLTQAQLDVEAAKAAFDYRYRALNDPTALSAPASSNRADQAAAVLIALLCAVAASVVADLRRGRVEAVWQLDRSAPVVAVVPGARIGSVEAPSESQRREVETLWFELDGAAQLPVALAAVPGAPSSVAEWLGSQLASVGSLAAKNGATLVDARRVTTADAYDAVADLRRIMAPARADVVVTSAPTVDPSAMPVIAAVGGVLLVVRIGASHRSEVDAMVGRIGPERVVGVVVVERPPRFSGRGRGRGRGRGGGRRHLAPEPGPTPVAVVAIAPLEPTG